MRVMLSEIDFERFVSKITEANNKKGEGKGGEGKGRGRIRSMGSICLSEFLTRGGVSYFLLFFYIVIRIICDNR